MRPLKRAWGYRPVRWAAIISSLTAAMILLLPGLRLGTYTADRFLPHATCYLRDAGLIWLNVLSDSFIAAAYLAISATLGYIVYKARHDIPFHWMFAAFGLFIVTCGFTHVMSVITVWRPYYWLAGDVKAITAVASVATAVVLPLTVPRVFTMIHDSKVAEQRKRDLEVAHERLKHSEELKSQFFANVSHELRTPLSLVLGPIRRQLDAGELAPEAREELEVAERNAGLLLQQVNNLLDLAKLEADELRPEYAHVDLAATVRLVSSYFEVVADERQIIYDMDTPDSLPAEADPDKAQRVFLNLLSNAFKFTPDGGSIRCTLSAEGESAIFVVEDSGPGIPEHLREIVFERFRQIEGGATRTAGGTGLGLSIVKEFIGLHGGAVTVGTAESGGARLEVRLPLRAPEGAEVSQTPPVMAKEPARFAADELQTYRPPPQAEASAAAAAADNQRPLVLVVEDNPEMNAFVAQALEGRYRVVSAYDGRQGLERARELQPDLIVTDLMMPHMSGDEMVEQLRAEPGLQEVPVVVLTAKADDQQRIDLLEQSVQDHLIKPFQTAELLARVDGHIRQRRATIEKLRQMNASLERRVAERTELVEQQAEQLRLLAADLSATEQRERRRLAQSLHDHLQQLLVTAKLSLEHASKLSGDAAADVLGRIKRLLDESLQASRDVTLELYPPVLYDRGFTTAVEWLARKSSQKYDLEVDVEIDGASEPEDQDLQAFLFSAVQELLLNVVKHASASHATITVGQANGLLAISVADDGVGCEPQSTVERRQSEGFGLFNIRERLHVLGGRMAVESQPGAGCTVRLEVPITASPEPRGAAPGSAPLSKGSRTGSPPPDERPIRVLLVDDHEVVRDGLAGMLATESSIEVVGQAASGEEALKLLDETAPEVVIMDVTMPGMGGVEATRQITERRPEVRVVALSMHPEQDMGTELRQAGAAAYVSKGAAAQDLINAIHNAKPRS